MNFKEIRLVLLLFLQLHPLYASQAPSPPKPPLQSRKRPGKQEKAWFFLVPEGRFPGGQEGDLNIDKKLKY